MGTSPVSNTNIYATYILPFIEAAQKGDEILYISPSTFFGFHSLGAGNFQRVCESLEEAKKRGVKIRLLIDIHDILTAKAAEGLLTFLIDKQDIRNFPDNVDIYKIMVYSPSGTSRYVEFSSKDPVVLRFLPGIQSRPFGDFIGGQEEMSADTALGHVKLFNTLWEKAGRVDQAIATYSPFYRARRYIYFYQGALNLASAAIGLLVGIVFVMQGVPKFDPTTLLVFIIAGIASGVLSNLVSNRLTSRLFE